MAGYTFGRTKAQQDARDQADALTQAEEFIIDAFVNFGVALLAGADPDDQAVLQSVIPDRPHTPNNAAQDAALLNAIAAAAQGTQVAITSVAPDAVSLAPNPATQPSVQPNGEVGNPVSDSGTGGTAIGTVSSGITAVVGGALQLPPVRMLAMWATDP